MSPAWQGRKTQSYLSGLLELPQDFCSVQAFVPLMQYANNEYDLGANHIAHYEGVAGKHQLAHVRGLGGASHPRKRRELLNGFQNGIYGFVSSLVAHQPRVMLMNRFQIAIGFFT
ncbi:hypothetical protein BKM04_06005 [Pseudomonas syringae pv. syringae]|nr:hypothetical protein BKM04_06005 [Pseudomonas syringae pv. syringae]POD63855.1 hypothetical protein BKM06_10445 [Pseudomonas syringae pv. syringae]